MSWRMDKSSSLGIPMHHPKKYPRSTRIKAWGCPRGTPFFIGKNQVTFQDTIFLLLHILCFFLERLYFCFHFCFVLFAAINGWITSCLFWRELCSVFIVKNTLVFTFIVQRVFSFSSTALSFRFLPWFLFRSCYLFVSRCI